ncbi:Uncharacterized protein PBTT_06827 [Plasmodiophora brassicae]
MVVERWSIHMKHNVSSTACSADDAAYAAVVSVNECIDSWSVLCGVHESGIFGIARIGIQDDVHSETAAGLGHARMVNMNDFDDRWLQGGDWWVLAMNADI